MSLKHVKKSWTEYFIKKLYACHMYLKQSAWTYDNFINQVEKKKISSNQIRMKHSVWIEDNSL